VKAYSQVNCDICNTNNLTFHAISVRRRMSIQLPTAATAHWKKGKYIIPQIAVAVAMRRRNRYAERYRKVQKGSTAKKPIGRVHGDLSGCSPLSHQVQVQTGKGMSDQAAD
jgi:actin-like ATPase involved in cell morphogenesis